MQFKDKLIEGKLIKRYKRFLADIELKNGDVVLAHCTNTGSMKSCIEAGAPVMLTPVNDPKRKTRFTWEMIFINNAWVGINTMNPNRFAYEAVQKNEIPGLEGYTRVKSEVKFGDSRFDLRLEKQDEVCFVEIKNVTMREGKVALFPDAVSARGLKHLNTLLEVRKSGMRAVMLYIIQRMDVELFKPAAAIDPDYAQTLRYVIDQGVEIIPAQLKVHPEGIDFHRILPYDLRPDQLSTPSKASGKLD